MTAMNVEAVVQEAITSALSDADGPDPSCPDGVLTAGSRRF
ncbi:hypothetical protein [Euzebya sp.]